MINDGLWPQAEHFRTAAIPSAIAGFADAPWLLAIRPSLDLVGLKHVGDRPQLCLLVRSLRAAGKGIVRELRDAPYRSGARSTWIKVKTDEWKAANRSQALIKEALTARNSSKKPS